MLRGWSALGMEILFEKSEILSFFSKAEFRYDFYGFRFRNQKYKNKILIKKAKFHCSIVQRNENVNPSLHYDGNKNSAYRRQRPADYETAAPALQQEAAAEGDAALAVAPPPAAAGGRGARDSIAIGRTAG